MIVDTHCHLYYDELNKNLEDTISKSEKAGIEKIIVPAVDLETSIQVTEMSEIYPVVLCGYQATFANGSAVSAVCEA